MTLSRDSKVGAGKRLGAYQPCLPRNEIYKTAKDVGVAGPVPDAHILLSQTRIQKSEQEIDEIVTARIAQFGVDLGSLSAKSIGRSLRQLPSKI